MAENKVRFLRGTATEYANTVKDDDTFYYTTDDGKFYVGEHELTGASNADTLDGFHADVFLRYLGGLTSGSILTKALELNASGFVYCSSAVADLPESNQYFFVDIRNSNGSIQLTATRFNNGATYTNRYNAGLKKWYGWKNIADGGHAATIDTIAGDIDTNTGNVYPVFVDSNNSTSTEETLKTSELLQFWASKGGVSQLTIGGKNSSSGLLKLCSSSEEYYSVLRAASSPTADVYCYFPDKSGTLALKEDIPTLATSATNGLMSAHDKLKLNYTNIAYATCDTAANTSAKVATISGNTAWSLAVGSIVTVKFSVTNTASNCTLNVNGTGAKQIWYHNGVYTGNSASVTGAVNTFVRFMYDGTYWVWIGHSADNSPGYASATAAGIVSTGAQHFKGQKLFDDSVWIPNPDIVMGEGAPSADTSRAFVFTSSDNSLSNASAWITNVARTSGNNELYLTVRSLTGKTLINGLAIKVNADNTNWYTFVSNPPQATQVALRNISSGKSEVSTTNCPSGSWYGKHS